MPRTCPQCAHTNPDTTAFCTRCGYRFPATDAIPGIPANADPADTLIPQAGQPAPATVSANAPASGSGHAYPATVAVPEPSIAPAGQYQQQQFAQNPPSSPSGYPQQAQVPTYTAAPYGTSAPQIIMPGQSTSGANSMQRAFAGKGTPVHHQSWLVSGNQQVQAVTLRTTLIDTIHRQGVMGVSAVPDRLREHSTALEERDFIKVTYGVSSIFIYLAHMGPNIYISRTSTVKQPNSLARILGYSTAAVFLVLTLILFLTVNTDLTSTEATADLKLIFGMAFFGLLGYFIYVLARSFFFFLTEQDFLALLRPSKLNDFTLDALSSVELVIDRSIRDTLTQSGLNASEITPPSLSYAPGETIIK